MNRHFHDTRYYLERASEATVDGGQFAVCSGGRASGSTASGPVARPGESVVEKG